MRWAWVLAFAASTAAAGAPDASIRPEQRPISADTAKMNPIVAGVILARGGAGPIISIRPDNRPANLHKAMGQRKRVTGGGICNDPSIQGERIAPIAGRIAGCGVPEAVRVRAVSGVPLSQSATIDCPTAIALRQWVDRGVRPAVGRQGGGVRSLQVAAHYVCRTRNHQPGARISEHGKGRAVDISAINLQDGSQISVLRDWGRGRKGAALKEMERAACGPFGTVLGPNADRFHRDHFHFDTARYRSGPYCR